MSAPCSEFEPRRSRSGLAAEDLIAFEVEVVRAFEAREIPAPVHLSGGNERELLQIFELVNEHDWVFSTYRSHYHALLHGVPRERVMMEIRAGRSMTLAFPEHRFFASAIVGGCLPIAVGAAQAIQRRGESRAVWCFVGDMAASIGAFHEARRYAGGHVLPITFVVEDNGLACDTPTAEAWGPDMAARVVRYRYERRHPHVGTGNWVQF